MQDNQPQIDPKFQLFFNERDKLRMELRRVNTLTHYYKRKRGQALLITFMSLGFFMPLWLYYIYMYKKHYKIFESLRMQLLRLGEDYKVAYNNDKLQCFHSRSNNIHPMTPGPNDYAQRPNNDEFDCPSDDFGGWDDGGYDGSDSSDCGGYGGCDGGGFDGGCDGGDGGDGGD